MQQLHPDSLLQGGKYRIVKVLGQGGFGITYLVRHTILEKDFAIKEFFYKDFCERDADNSHVTLGTSSSRELVERFMAKFLKEARTISSLEHPNIIRIHDIFKENNTAYYVMEYIEGESLAEKVKSQGALPEQEAIGYIKQVASALDFIHQRSINHLDVKPANIMVRSSDNVAVLIDFGLSKQYDAEGTQTSTTPVGISHGYAAIEQYKQGGVSTFSPETDIYALGATLYKLVTGNTPPQPMDILAEGTLSLPNFISTSVGNAINKAMQVRKVDRVKSVSEFLSLTNYCEDTLVKKEKHSTKNNNKNEETQIITDHFSSTETKENKRKKTSRKNIIIAILVGLLFIGFFGFFANITTPNNDPKSPEEMYQKACEHINKNQYSNAIKLLKKAANMGHAPAQADLGYYYSVGEGIGKNYTLALEWTKKAANQNNVIAYHNLGTFYYNGIVINKNLQNAMHWWNKAANLGYSESQYSLGCCYLYGKGVKKNSKIAKEWIAKAAAQGHEEAQKTLKTINTTNNHSNYTIPQINWRNISGTDQMLLNNDVDKCIRFLESIPSNELDEWEKETKKYALSLLKAPKLSIIPFDLINYKKVRSIQCHKYNNVYAQGYGVIEYDFFNCKFTIQTNNQLFFRKTSGSQRKSGHIYKKDSTSCIFLGGWSVNDDPQTKYGSENSQAGTLYRIAENKMLMVFYGSPDSFELYEIIK